MSLVDEIRTTQAETIVKYEEKLRLDKDIVLKVFHEMMETIRKQVQEYYYAKDTNYKTFKFVLTDFSMKDKYEISINGETYKITVKEYQAILNSFLNGGFKISQSTGEERVYGKMGCVAGIHVVRNLTVEW
jgi:predicted AlkP superfamily phosphohydrolase/phosphomutase